MKKRNCGVRLEKEIVERLERLATADRRTLSNLIEICVQDYLPRLEADILYRNHGSLLVNDAMPATSPPPAEVATSYSSIKHKRKVA